MPKVFPRVARISDWMRIKQTHQVGMRVTVRVDRVVGFGALCTLVGKKFTPATIRKREWSWNPAHQNCDCIGVGDTFDAIVTGLDDEWRDLIVSRRAAEPTPFDQFADNHKVGDIVDCEIHEVTSLGLLVSLGGALEGRISYSDIPVIPRIDDSQLTVQWELRKGDSLLATIKSLDRTAGKIRLSVRDAVERVLGERWNAVKVWSIPVAEELLFKPQHSRGEPMLLSSMHKALSVLLLEDTDGIRNHLKYLLEDRRHRVQVAASYGAAERAIDSAISFDVAMIDLHLASYSAEPLIRQLRSRFPSCRILLMSGDVDGLQRFRDVEILYKPFDADTAISCVEGTSTHSANRSVVRLDESIVSFSAASNRSDSNRGPEATSQVIRDYLDSIVLAARADAGTVMQLDTSTNCFSCLHLSNLPQGVFVEFQDSLRPSYIGDLLAGFSNFADEVGVALADTQQDVRNEMDQMVLRRCGAQRMIGFGLQLESFKNPLAVVLFYRDRRTKLSSEVSRDINQRLQAMAIALDRANWDATISKQQRSIAAGGLLLGLSHEIRNYLTTFELLNTRLTNGLRNASKNPAAFHDCKQCAEQLSSEVRSIKHSLDSVLELARTNHDGRTCKLCELVKRVDAQCRETAEQEGVLFVLEYAKCAQVDEMIVPISLSQVVSNLVINAIQHTKCFRGDDRAWIKLELSKESNQAVLRVSDNGFGIDGVMHEKIFDMFHSTRTNGSGLGLYVAQMIVSSLGGELTVESSHKFIGTQMKLMLPLSGSIP